MAKKKTYAWEGGNMLPNKSKTEFLSDVPVGNVKPYADNAFDHSLNVKDIANSIINFGYSKVSVGVDENDVILYGHGTLQAIKLIGWEKIPTVLRITGLTEDEKNAYRIADNTTTRRSKMIGDLIKKEADKQQCFDMDLFGLSGDDLMKIQKPATVGAELAEIGKNFADKEGAPEKVGIKKMWLYVEFNNEADYNATKEILTDRGTRELNPQRVKIAAQLLQNNEQLFAPAKKEEPVPAPVAAVAAPAEEVSAPVVDQPLTDTAVPQELPVPGPVVFVPQTPAPVVPVPAPVAQVVPAVPAQVEMPAPAPAPIAQPTAREKRLAELRIMPAGETNEQFRARMDEYVKLLNQEEPAGGANEATK